MDVFCQAKRAWFQQFLDLPHGTPSHDTFGRVLRRRDAEQFQTCFLSWVQAVGGATVGWALHALPVDSEVPWQRVINAHGRISTSCHEHDAGVQRQLLEAEGVVFDERGYVDRQRFQWEGLPPWEVADLWGRAAT